MANAKITALTAMTTAVTGDVLAIVDDPAGTPLTQKITYGNLIASFASIGQLPFPATQSASAGANTLDDYEEGTFTPAANGVTFGTAVGFYTKIGRVVFIAGYVIWPATANGSAALIGGLPFTVAAGMYFTGSRGYTTESTLTGMSMDTATAVIALYAGTVALTNANMSTDQVNYSGFYFV